MSRWSANFDTHQFHKSWEALLKEVNSVDEKLLTDNTIVIELARLRKVIEYIDKYIKLIDPDINITNFAQSLDNLNQFITNVANELNQFITNPNIAYIQSANNNIDNCLNTIKGFHTILPNVSGQGISAMLRKYNKTLEDALSEIDLTLTIQSSSEIQKLKEKLLDGVDEEDSVALQIDYMLKDAEEKHDKLLEFYNKTLNDFEYDDTTKETITKSKEEITQYLKTANNETTEISTKIDKLNKFYVKIFGELNDENERVGGLKSELDKRGKTLDDFETTQKTKYKTLIGEIESLLPGATSVGLAEAYNQERKNFKEPVILWTWVFIASLIGMFVTSLFTLNGVVGLGLADTGRHILQTLPIIAPLVWLATFASKRRSENQRLEQEYAHKEALAKSYSSYKQQIEDINQQDQELLVKLLDTSIDTMSNNASETLDKKHGDGTPIQEMAKSLIDEVKKVIPESNK